MTELIIYSAYYIDEDVLAEILALQNTGRRVVVSSRFKLDVQLKGWRALESMVVAGRQETGNA